MVVSPVIFTSPSLSISTSSLRGVSLIVFLVSVSSRLLPSSLHRLLRGLLHDDGLLAFQRHFDGAFLESVGRRFAEISGNHAVDRHFIVTQLDRLGDGFGANDFAQPDGAAFDLALADFELLFAELNAHRFTALHAIPRVLRGRLSCSHGSLAAQASPAEREIIFAQGWLGFLKARARFVATVAFVASP